MNEFITYIQLVLTYPANGLLVLVYMAWSHMEGLVAGAAFGHLLWRAPEAQRVWIAGASGLVLLAAFLAPPPVPFLLAWMAMIGSVAVRVDRFNPEMLRWRSMPRPRWGIWSMAGIWQV